MMTSDEIRDGIKEFIAAIEANDPDQQVGLVHMFCHAIDDGGIHPIEAAYLIEAAIGEDDDGPALQYLRAALAIV